jgi:hypothetical protein
VCCAAGADPSTVLETLGALNVPTALMGSAYSDCAPLDANYERFEAALGSRSPRLVGVLRRAGHTQFVDQRRVLSVDVCTTGKDKDAQVREVACAMATAWAGAALSATEQQRELRRAADGLRERSFAASVLWRTGGLDV